MKEVRVYVPSKDKDGEDLNAMQRSAWCSMWVASLSCWFGGATSIVGYGHWLDKNEYCHSEGVNIISAYGSADQFAEHYKELKHLAEDMKGSLEQESVMFSITPVDEVVFV